MRSWDTEESSWPEQGQNQQSEEKVYSMAQPSRKIGRATCVSCGFTDLYSFFQLLRGEQPKCPDCKSTDVAEGEPELRCSNCGLSAVLRRHRMNIAVAPLRCHGCQSVSFEAVPKVPAGYI